MNLIAFALKLDALVTGANGAAYLLGASALDGFLGVSEDLLVALGAFLLAFAAVVWTVAQRPSPAAVSAVVAANAAWVVASLAFVAFDWATPSTEGAVWAVMQAATVAGFAALQAYALRRGRGTLASSPASSSSPRSR